MHYPPHALDFNRGIRPRFLVGARQQFFGRAENQLAPDLLIRLTSIRLTLRCGRPSPKCWSNEWRSNECGKCRSATRWEQEETEKTEAGLTFLRLTELAAESFLGEVACSLACCVGKHCVGSLLRRFYSFLKNSRRRRLIQGVKTMPSFGRTGRG